ncbi:endonuclease MutS2 [Tuberibacillus sp. Marseille-P3662]|uniref:endonuclease MutS2 n=1 Tax=Tuberibacillus sp. Marseille-P3662 TaxID=1965358 RepID=UPI000A1CC7FD|nr:endonuclease MutS2 [Tuberibacillus sp. Marseille-P3662]
MQDRVLKLLEYEKVIEQLKQHASSSLGETAADHLRPETEKETISQMIEETDEGVNILRLKGHFPFGGITDIRPQLKRTDIGGVLNAGELMAIADTIRGSRIVKHFITELIEEDVQVPRLYGRVQFIEPLTTLEHAIRDCVDEQGGILDTASDQLRSIRTQIKTFDSRIKDKLSAMTRSNETRKMLSEAIVTIRNDRYVIPVKAESKAAFGGIVHDQSASGATFFVEPRSIVDINNQLNEAKGKERHEVERILRQLSEQVSSYVSELQDHVDALAQVDFIMTRAKYAQSLRATKPVVSANGRLNYKKARHPLLSEQEAVPINIILNRDEQAMIVTGPNTGGKTVTLKTTGLLTLMAQSGLHLPVEDGSEFVIYKHVFADIGDEQSIEQNLSTFSSHMTNIVEIIDQVDHESLVLFDELGAGTDPQEGAALSIAILDDVRARGATILATTHYSELKAYAFSREGVINASVEFDIETLSPTYRLLIGVPGRSNAFEISQRLGLSEKIIHHAKEQIGADTSKVDQMIASLETNRKEAEEAREEAETVRAELREQQAQLNQEQQELEAKKEQIIKRTEQKAKDRLEKVRGEAADIIEDLRNKQKNVNAQVKDHELIEAKSHLDHALDTVTNQTKSSENQEENNQAIRQTFEPGQEVKVQSFGQKGSIVERLNDQEYLVQVGIMKMNIKASDLKPVKEEKQTKPVVNVKGPSKTTKTELDLRGERYEEAMNRLDQYLDAALLAGYPQVSIIHGKGTGVLRKAVQKKLTHHPRVKNTRLGGMGEGGSGVTVVEFK